MNDILNIFANKNKPFTMEDVRQKYATLKQNETVAQQSPQVSFSEYDELYEYIKQNPDTAKWQWVEIQEDVVKADNAVKNIFSLWLFENYKADFSKWVKDNNIPEIKDYVKTAITKSKEYRTPADIFADERKAYEQRITNLEEIVKNVTSKKEDDIIL